MTKSTAWVILLAAGGLVYSLAFTSYEHATNRWETTDSGGPTRVRVECPPPWKVLLLDAEPASERDHGSCELSSRTLTVEAGFVVVVAFLLAWKPITRPEPERLETLSETIGRVSSGRG